MTDLLQTAKKRFDRVIDAESDNRELMIDDLKFAKGGTEQWPEDQRKDRVGGQFKRPMLTINRTRAFVKRITGDIRQNSPQIKLFPVDDETDPDVTEIFEGIIRHIEQSSSARTAYNTAVNFQVKAGYGVWTIETDYADDDRWEQDIFIRRKRNPFTVYIDPDAEEVCKQDMKWAFETEWIDRADFDKRYPNAELGDFSSNQVGENWERWYSKDKVRIARYWYKKPVKKTLGITFDGSVMDTSSAPYGVQFKDTREVMKNEIEAAIITADEVLDGPFPWPGKYIPIVPLYGEEDNVEGRTEYKGIVRDLQDPARMYNYWRTTAIETLALQPKTPWQATPDQIKGFEKHYDAANKANLPVLPYNPDPQAPQPPFRAAPPQPPAAMWQEALNNQEDMKAVANIYDASLGAQSNETSGIAIQRRQQESNTANYDYVDNLTLAIEQTGRILVDLIPKIYDTERAVRVLGEDGEEAIKRVNQVRPDGVFNDITTAKYDVRVSVGPSYTTRRQEAADLMIQLMQAVPGVGQTAGDLIVKNFDIPGAEEVAARIKRSLPPGLIEPDPDTEEGQAQLQAAQVDAQMQEIVQQLQFAQAQAELREKEASAAQKEADALKKQVESMQVSQELVNREEVMQIIQEEIQRTQNVPEALLGDITD